MTRRALSPLALLLGLVASCAPVQTLEPGTCGNGVIDTEVGEDCDVLSVDGFPCRQPDQTFPCTFACTAEGACPAGYGCGTDDVCRRPSGNFEPSSFAQASSQAGELLVGDFDNDRRADVVAVEPGHTRIHFFGESGLAQQITFASSVRPSIGKLGAIASGNGTPVTLDTTDDLALSLNLGIGALVSEGDQTFRAHTFGSISLDGPENGLGGIVLDAMPLAFDALPNGPQLQDSGDEACALLGMKGANGGEDGLFANFSTAGSGILFPIAGGGPSRLSGPPVTAHFDSNGCEQIAFPIKGKSTLSVYATCVFNVLKMGYDWAPPATEEGAKLAEIALGESVIAGPAFAFDVDGDGRSDLLVTASGPDGVLHLRVAYAVGKGRFHSTPGPAVPPADFVPDQATSLYANLVSDGPQNGRVPLALGDFNQDGVPDLVDASHVLLGSKLAFAGPDGQQATFTATYTSPRSWTEAVVADVNGNGFLDVIAATEGARDIDILNGNPSSFWNPSQLSTTGTVSNLVVNDFDGDVVGDVAFQNTVSPGESLLMIAYGRTTGGPEEPLQVGNFPKILRMVSGDIHSFGVDSIADLGVVSSTAGELALSFFPGAGSRFMQAPFLLTDPKSGKVHQPLQTGLGLLRGGIDDDGDGDGAHNDLAVIAFEQPAPQSMQTDLERLVDYTNSMRLWGLFGAGEADFLDDETALCPMPQGTFVFPGLERAVSVVIAGSAPGEAGRTFVGAPRMTFGGASVIQVRGMLAEATFDGSRQCEVAEPLAGAEGELFSRVQTADLNGDGVPEVLALRETFDPEAVNAYFKNGLAPVGGPFPAALSSQLVVFWGGVLGEDGELLPSLIPDQPSHVADYTIADIDGDLVPEVLTVGGGGLYRYTLGPDGASLVGGPKSDVDLYGTKTILVADVDGDGVKDLVSGANGLQFYRGIPQASEVVVVDPADR